MEDFAHSCGVIADLLVRRGDSRVTDFHRRIQAEAREAGEDACRFEHGWTEACANAKAGISTVCEDCRKHLFTRHSEIMKPAQK